MGFIQSGSETNGVLYSCAHLVGRELGGHRRELFVGGQGQSLGDGQCSGESEPCCARGGKRMKRSTCLLQKCRKSDMNQGGGAHLGYGDGARHI